MSLGMSENSVSQSVTALQKVLANTYVILVKTQNYHWHVEGSNFSALHLMFEKQYEQMAEAIDEIAERTRALGSKSVASMQEFLEIAEINEDLDPLSRHDLEMCEILMNDHIALVSLIRSLLAEITPHGDDATIDLLIERLREHDKIQWMLQATIQ